MDTVTPYESAKSRRYRVRYRKPDHTEAEKRGFTTTREAQLYLSMVTVSKSKGEYIDPTSSSVPVRMFADSWLRSKQPPMSKPSYCVTLERAWKNHVAPVGEIGRSTRSDAPKSRTGCPTSRRASRAPSSSVRSALSPASSTSRSTIVASRAIRPATSA